MFKNPEFNRYITYKSSPGFWLWPPAMILFVTWMLQIAFEIQYKSIAVILGCGYCFSIFIYGLVNAGSAFSSEFKNKTWDFQRLSPMRPISLVIGKLFGSTAYSWYIGGFFLLAAYLTVLQGGNATIISDYSSILILLVIIGLFSHIFAFWASAGASTSGFEAGLVGAIALLFLLVEIGDPSRGERLIHWYALQVPLWKFAGISLLFYGFWLFRASIAVTWERMQYERGYPIDWFIFLFSVGAYCAGFFHEEPGTAVGMFCFTMMLTLYAGMFFSSGDWDRHQVVAKGLRKKDLSLVIKYAPRWTSALVLLLGAIVFSWFYFDGLKGNMGATLLSSITLFILRDGIVFHIIFMKKVMKRGIFILILYYLFAYKLLPDLFSLDFNSWLSSLDFKGGETQANFLHSLFFPNINPSLWLFTSLIVMAECALGLWLLKIRLKKIDEMDIENEKRERLSG